MDFDDYDRLIKTLARRYGGDLREIDYLESVGRVTCTKEIERGNNKDNIERILESKFSVLTANQEISKRDESHVFRYPDDQDPKDIINRFIERLKKRHGKYYVKAISDGKDSIEKVAAIFRFVIEEVHKIPVEEIPQRVNYKFLRENQLERLLWTFYRNSPYQAMRDAFPGQVVPWNFKRKPHSFWKGKIGNQRALDSVEWFVNKKGIKSIDDCMNITTQDFEEENLGAMLQIHFNSSGYLALKTQFTELQPWNMKRATQGYYNIEKNRLEALLGYLLEHKIPSIIQLTPEEIYECGLRAFVSKEDMCEKGFRGLLRPYNGSVYQTFNSLLPGKILPWTLHSVKEPWRKNPKETATRAIKWLFDDYLQIPPSDTPRYATCDLFWRVGFSGIMTNRAVGYNSSPYRAINSAYPNQFSKEDFKRTRLEPCPKINTPKLIRHRKLEVKRNI